jgi:hypothetical protein
MDLVLPALKPSPLKNSSFIYNTLAQKAEIETEALTGVKVSHTTQQKLVLSQDFQLPLAKQSVSKASVDGGKVRLRGKPKEGCHWRDYKTVPLQGIYYDFDAGLVSLQML